MDTAYDKINDSLAQLEDARKEIARYMHGMKALVKGLPCDSDKLLTLLHELADAEQDCSEHFGRFESERSKPYDEQSEECRNDWTRCYNRRLKAVAQVTKFANTLKLGEEQAA